jgi:hypothetical protein
VLKAWPNPVRGSVTVGLGDDRVWLVSTAGVVLQEVTVREPVFSIPLDGFPAGIYLLHTADDKVVRVTKE